MTALNRKVIAKTVLQMLATSLFIYLVVLSPAAAVAFAIGFFIVTVFRVLYAVNLAYEEVSSKVEDERTA
jgi:ABC-type multidrug transport system permease subunit